MNTFLSELRRRNVFRVAGAYVIIALPLVHLAATLENTLILPDWFDTLVTILVILSFPVSMFFAWAFEMTPDGMRPTQSVAKEDSIAHQTGRKLDFAILGGLVLIGAFLVFNRLSPSAVQSPNASVLTASNLDSHSVAVLPFANRSSLQADAFFAEGIHEDLLTKLAKISDLQVISRTSVMGYKDTQKRIPDIAQELGAAVILEGGVQRAGDRVRITVQLIDGATDTHLWAENYDRELTAQNLFDIQNEIAQVVAQSLKAVLSGADRAQLEAPLTDDLKAYEDYIQARLLSQTQISSEDDFRASLALFDAAIAKDPGFAAAWAGKASAQLSIYRLYRGGPSMLAAAKRSLDEARALSPNAIETLTPLGLYHFWGDKDFEAANRVFDQALEISPNAANIWAGKGFIARHDGAFKASAAYLETAHNLDPLSYYLMVELALTQVLAGNFDAANAMVAKAKAARSANAQGATFEASIWQFQGEAQKAWEAVAPVYDDGDAFYYDQRVKYALSTGEETIIKTALETWPVSSRSHPAVPEIYEVSRARVLHNQGRVDEARTGLNGILTRIGSASSEVSGDSRRQAMAAAGLSPAIYSGLMGDIAGVEAAATLPNRRDQ